MTELSPEVERIKEELHRRTQAFLQSLKDTGNGPEVIEYRRVKDTILSYRAAGFNAISFDDIFVALGIEGVAAKRMVINRLQSLGAKVTGSGIGKAFYFPADFDLEGLEK